MPEIDPSLLLEVAKRSEWRAWLRLNYRSAKVVWLVSYKKHTGRPRVAYNDAVEEALAFGWIDSTVHRLDDDRYAQRFTPRRPGSSYSEANLARLRAMAEAGKVAPDVLARVQPLLVEKPVRIPPDILAALKSDPETWRNFQAFSEPYKRIRIAYIDDVRVRPEEFAKRLRNFLRMTKKNRIIGFGGIQKHY
jgi:uncharacterized protein YdeI (YjbR/CyaY-like superfamily)